MFGRKDKLKESAFGQRFICAAIKKFKKTKQTVQSGPKSGVQKSVFKRVSPMLFQDTGVAVTRCTAGHRRVEQRPEVRQRSNSELNGEQNGEQNRQTRVASRTAIKQ